MKQEDIDRRIAERVERLGRKLTAKELIDVINELPDEPQELVFEPDEDLERPQ